jgi:hypothetical protein
VILNRVRNPTYPNTVCGVVYQNDNWRNRCQFSFACDGIKDRVRSPKHWNVAEEIALATTAGKIWLKEVGLFHPLSRHLCAPALGKENAQGWQDRPAYLLCHLWRRLVLIDWRLTADAGAARHRQKPPPGAPLSA